MFIRNDRWLPTETEGCTTQPPHSCRQAGSECMLKGFCPGGSVIGNWGNVELDPATLSLVNDVKILTCCELAGGCEISKGKFWDGKNPSNEARMPF